MQHFPTKPLDFFAKRWYYNIAVSESGTAKRVQKKNLKKFKKVLDKHKKMCYNIKVVSKGNKVKEKKILRKFSKKDLTNAEKCDIIKKLLRATKQNCTLKNKQCRVLVEQAKSLQQHEKSVFYMTEKFG